MTRRRFLRVAVPGSGATLLVACTSRAAPTPTAPPASPTQAAPAVQAASPAPAGARLDTPSPRPASSPVVSPVTSPVVAASTPPAQCGNLARAPDVFNVADARQHAGTSLTYYGDSTDVGYCLDWALANRFSQDTGITVTVVKSVPSSTDAYVTYQNLFQAQSALVDVLTIDVIWPGALGEHLADLGAYPGLSPQEIHQHYPEIIENNRVNGRLVALPYWLDIGVLYYRPELARSYGFNASPGTWDELEQQAGAIVAKERLTSPEYSGFIFQGNAYEGLTCNVLEWLASSGGGTLINANRMPTVSNSNARDMLDKVKRWAGSISMPRVMSYQEEESLAAFRSGQAAFMRHWLSSYRRVNGSGGQASPVMGRVDVAPLPAQPGFKPSSTVGGWQLAVSKYSRNTGAAIELVRYLASQGAQAYRAQLGHFIPTIPEVEERPAVSNAMPFLANVRPPVADLKYLVRPSKQAGSRYNDASKAVFQGVNRILRGEDAAQTLGRMQGGLNARLGP